MQQRDADQTELKPKNASSAFQAGSSVQNMSRHSVGLNRTVQDNSRQQITDKGPGHVREEPLQQKQEDVSVTSTLSRDSLESSHESGLLGKRLRPSDEEEDKEHCDHLNPENLSGGKGRGEVDGPGKPFRNVVKRYWTEQEVGGPSDF
jgi:hypothetical protein